MSLIGNVALAPALLFPDCTLFANEVKSHKKRLYSCSHGSLVVKSILFNFSILSLPRAMGKSHNRSAFWHLLLTNLPRYGGLMERFSIIVFMLRVICSSACGAEKDATRRLGESVNIRITM